MDAIEEISVTTKKNVGRKALGLLLAAGMILGSFGGTVSAESTASEETTAETALSTIDMSKWSYNSDDNVYYQIGVQYAENSPDESYDSLAVFVPGDYFTATDNGDGTYTCEINVGAEVSGFSCSVCPAEARSRQFSDRPGTTVCTTPILRRSERWRA